MKFFKETTFQDVNYSSEDTLKLLREYKVLLIRDYKQEEDPLEFFTKFSEKLGYSYALGEDLKTGERTGNNWIDITYDPDVPNKYRSAPVGQPLHTDMSYDPIYDNIQFFYCVSQAKYGGATTFIDANFLVELLELAGENDLLRDIQETDVIHSKSELKRVSPILRKEEGEWHLNWNYFCCDESNTPFAKELFERFHNFLETRVVKSGVVSEGRLNKNDVVFFHDERILHGRNAYFAEHKGQRSLNKGTIILEERAHKNRHLKLVKN